MFFYSAAMAYTMDIACSQPEHNTWYFGNYHGLDFNSGVPVALTNSAMLTSEGSACISDSSGSLLFYTNGMTVWNKNHVSMPNGTGLFGHHSSTQSSLIVQLPGNSTIYYIFTVEMYSALPQSGLWYSIVDITLDSGLGDITVKNMPLHSPITEKITAVKHCNNTDIWIISHEWNSTAFLAYLLTDTGIVSNPVISNTGQVHGPFQSDAVGYLRASPYGNKLVTVGGTVIPVEIFNFNRLTGEILLLASFTQPVAYGAEFSPDGSKLYLVCCPGFSPSKIYQFDMNYTSPADILNSLTVIGTPDTNSFGAIQLGPDGKIYAVKVGLSSIGVINAPNQPDTACNYSNQSAWLPGNMNYRGLPNFFFKNPLIPPINSIYFTYSDTCLGDTTLFNITSVPYIDSILWNFGDTASGSLNIAKGFNTPHKFSSSGYFNVLAIVYSPCLPPDTIKKIIKIFPLPTVNFGNDTILCTGDSLLLNASVDNATYQWQNGSIDSTFNVIQAGIYEVQVSNQCGTTSDTISVSFQPLPFVTLGNDTFLCNSDTMILIANSQNAATYLWNDGSTDSIYYINNSGIKWVQVSNNCGTVTDTIVISSVSLPIVFLGNDTTLCEGNSLLLSIPTCSCSYLWNDGSSSENYRVTINGTYWALVNNPCSAASDTVLINFQNCDTIEPPSPNQNNVFLPGIFSPNSDGNNDIFRVRGSNMAEGYISIYNRWGEKVFDLHFTQNDISDVTKWWDGTQYGKPLNTAVFVFYCIVTYLDGSNETKIGNVTLIK